MEYNDFLSDAKENYKKLPEEQSELYKKNYVHVPEEYVEFVDFEANANYGESDETAVRSYEKGVAEKMDIRFDLVLGSNFVSVPKNKHIEILQAGSMERGFFDGKLFKSADDKFAALINAKTERIIRIKLGKGEKESFNIMFVNTSRQLFSQVICEVAEGAELDLFEWHGSDAQRSSVQGIINEAKIEERAKMNLVVLHNENENTAVLDMRKGTVKSHGSFVQHFAYIGGRVTRARGSVNLNGNDAHTDNAEIVLGTLDQKMDICTDIVNAAKGSLALLDSKAVLADTSRCILKGFASIKDGAVASRSFVHERGLLLDNTAKIDSIPGMSVDEYDVKATHSSATAPIDEESLFYLGSRGMSKTQANLLLVDGFLGSNITKIKDTRIVYAISSILHDKVINKKYGIVPELREESMLIGTGSENDGERLLEEHYKYR